MLSNHASALIKNLEVTLMTIMKQKRFLNLLQMNAIARKCVYGGKSIPIMFSLYF